MLDIKFSFNLSILNLFLLLIIPYLTIVLNVRSINKISLFTEAVENFFIVKPFVQSTKTSLPISKEV